MIPLDVLKETDPLHVRAQKSEAPQYSPMDPPEAYQPPGTDAIAYEEMHKALQGFVDEHRAIEKQLVQFETVLHMLRELGPNKEALDGLKSFYEYLDQHVVPHNLKEEKLLFPLLQPHLIETGAHSKGPFPKTSLDVLEDDHSKIMQLASVSFSFFGIAARLPDPASRAMVFDAAIEQGTALVEHLRLHIFREDNVVFPQVQTHCSREELDGVLRRVPRYAEY